MVWEHDITCSAAQFHAEILLKGPAWISDHDKGRVKSQWTSWLHNKENSKSKSEQAIEKINVNTQKYI